MTHLTPNNLDIRVSDAVIEGGNVSYRISLMHPMRPNVTVAYVMRRFSDLEPIMKRLKDLPATVPPLPPVPEKKFFGNTAPEFVEKRRQDIESFLRAVAYNQDLCSEDDFLKSVGYPPPPAALSAAGVDISMSTGLASAVGALKSSKSPRSPKGPAPTSVESLMQTTPWLRGPPTHFTAEQDIAAAQGWVRGTPFRLIRALPPLSYRRNCKTNFLLEDPSQPAGSKESKLILSVYTPDPQLSIAIPDEKKLSYIVRTICTALGSSQPNFAAPIVFTADKGRMFVVRKYYQSGSLLDLMFAAGGESLVEATRKYASKPKPFSSDHIAIVGKQLLLVARQCHEFNIPLPNLHIGNIFLDGEKMSLDKSPIVISDVESSLLGLTNTPVMLPVSGREEVDTTATHIDILRIGLILLSLAVGMPLRADVEVQLLRCWGTPWMPSWQPPNDEEDDDEDEDGKKSSKTSKTSKNAKKDIPPDAPMAPPDSVFAGVQDPLLSILKFIFLPNNKCEIDTLLNHSYFKNSKLPKSYRQGFLVDPQDVSKKNENGVLPSLTGLKKKDVELFSEAAAKWTTLMEAAEEAKIKLKGGRTVAKELKKIGREKRKEAIANAAAEEQEQQNNLSASVSLIASPLEKRERPKKSPRQAPLEKPTTATATATSPAPVQQQQQQPTVVSPPAPQPTKSSVPAPTPTTPQPTVPTPQPTTVTTSTTSSTAAPSPAQPPSTPSTLPKRPAGHADLMAAIRGAAGGGGSSTTTTTTTTTNAAPTPTPSSSSTPQAPAPVSTLPKRPAGHADLMAAIRGAAGGGGGATTTTTPSTSTTATTNAAPTPASSSTAQAPPPVSTLPKRPPGHADLMAAIRAAKSG